ncbi:siroheme synthase [Rickenella mellea]|uniref:precorrin-2 dehydrogenase n=1 Tax=Rickenella mellea TaxID=50990 RepID=A0A4Y7QK13_9AGAM|nr:siroheme synthase [Rickenella mellea]
MSVTGGGSLLLAWRLKDKRVLIVGGGDVASGRIEAVLVADALVTIISPALGLHPQTRHFIENSDRVTYHDRVFQGHDDLDGVDMVLTAIDDVEWSRQICALCRELKIPVNVADIPPSCDFYFGSQIRRGPLQIMISTNGNGPKLANIIKKRIEGTLPENVEEAIEKIGALRAKLRERAPGVGGLLGKKRMRWMVSVCNTWSIDELARLGNDSMEKLLVEGWDKGRVLKPHETGVAVPWWWNIPPQVTPGIAGFTCGVAVTVAIFILRRR